MTEEKYSTLSILNELAATTKRTEKEEILRREIDNQTLSDAFWAAYNPDLAYWIKKHPLPLRTRFLWDQIQLSDAIDCLQNLASRVYTGHAGIEYYAEVLASAHDDDAVVLRRIIDRDLKCGVGIPTINKIWPGLIPDYNIMLASTDPSRLEFPVFCQIKYDGIRCLVTKTADDKLIIRTRNGKRLESLVELNTSLIRELQTCVERGETWDGELLVFSDEYNVAERKVGNGILNKAIRGTIAQDQAELIRFIAWDIIDLSGNISYLQRLNNLEHRLNLVSAQNVILATTDVAEDMGELTALFQSALKNGYEGVIAKNIDAKYQPKRTKDLVKFKEEQTADLIVVDWEEGKPGSKYEGKLGALVCESADSKIHVNVGTGFSDELRESLSRDNTVDHIVEVCYNQRISSNGDKPDSLYLPRFVQFRGDKSDANTSNEIK